jgi:hypothetical protein
MFYPQSGGRTVFKFPATPAQDQRLGRGLLANADCFDSNGLPCLIVIKDGNITDLTVGRYADLEAYLCDELLHSWMARGGSSHVTYATPAWWAIEQVKLEYPNADFNRETFY